MTSPLPTSLRMAYLILAHDNPEQLALLLDRLLLPGTTDIAIIHADRRSALWHALRSGLPGPAGRVHLVADPVAVRWGHWSQVAAEALLVRDALCHGCDSAHLLSGADWPVVPRTTLATAMAAGQCHVEVRPGHLEERMQTFRLDTRWLRLDPEADRHAYAFTWQLRRLARWSDAARLRLGITRSRPWGTWAYGSQWWSLPHDALAVLGTALPALLASGRLKGTVCSDEHVIPTIIAHHFPDRLAPPHRFIAFDQGASSPRLLTAQDSAAILASGAWFARKVSLDHDAFFRSLPGSAAPS